MALLGGGPRKRLNKAQRRALLNRLRAKRLGQRTSIIEAAGPIKPILIAGGSLLRRFGKKIPGLRNIIPGSAARIARAERLTGIGGLSGSTVRSTSKFRQLKVARPGRTFQSQLKPVAVTAAKLVAGGAALEGGARVLETVLGGPSITLKPGAGIEAVITSGRDIVAHPGIGAGGGGSLELGGHAPPGNTIVKVWDTGTAKFARDASGMHYVQKKDGTIKRFRPPRPVCIPKKWDSRSMSRVMRRLGSHQKSAIKLIQMMGGTASKTRHAHRSSR